MRRRHEQDLVFAILALAPLIGAIVLALFSVLMHRLRRHASGPAPSKPGGRRLSGLLEVWTSWMERMDPQARFWGPAAAGLLLGLLWTLIRR